MKKIYCEDCRFRMANLGINKNGNCKHLSNQKCVTVYERRLSKEDRYQYCFSVNRFGTCKYFEPKFSVFKYFKSRLSDY